MKLNTGPPNHSSCLKILYIYIKNDKILIILIDSRNYKKYEEEKERATFLTLNSYVQKEIAMIGYKVLTP
jgi:hypothetical protein